MSFARADEETLAVPSSLKNRWKTGMTIVGRQLVAVALVAEDAPVILLVDAIAGMAVVKAHVNTKPSTPYTLRVFTGLHEGSVDVGAWTAAEVKVVHSSAVQLWSHATLAKSDPAAVADGKPIKAKPSNAQVEAAIARATAQMQSQPSVPTPPLPPPSETLAEPAVLPTPLPSSTTPSFVSGLEA